MADSEEILAAANAAKLIAQDADNAAHDAKKASEHTEKMVGSLIQALKDKGVIDEKSPAKP